jgi:FlaG protein
MSDSQFLPVGPVSPVSGAPAVRRVGRDARTRGAANQRDVAAVTAGSLHSAYAQLVVDPDTHDVVIRVRDATTHELIREYPSSEVQHMDKAIKDYVDALARRNAQRNAQG